MATRRTFNPDADDGGKQIAPTGSAHTCAQPGCRLAGSLNSGGGGWWCPFHWNVEAADRHRVTSILVQHLTIVELVVEGQRMLVEHPLDGGSHTAWAQVAAKRFRDYTGRDATEFQPSRVGPAGLAAGALVYAALCYLGGEVSRANVRRLPRQAQQQPGQLRLPAAALRDSLPAQGGGHE